MNGAPFNNPSLTPDPFMSIGDEVQEELDRHAAFVRATGFGQSVSPVTDPQLPLEVGALMGVLLGPFVYVALVLVCQRFFAPELLQDGEYKFLLLGSLPYALMWGGYLGARLPAVLSATSWRSVGACLGLIACLGTMIFLGCISAVARLYMPLYALPIASIVWVELAARYSD